MAEAALINDRREIRNWMMYDWANSAFSTTVAGVFLGPYLTGLVKSQVGENGVFYLLGLPIGEKSFFAYCVGISVFLQVFILPLLGAIADYSHLKKRMMLAFAVIGAAATIGLFTISGTLYVLGGLLFIIANLAFGASIVFYNSFLPQIASEDQRDRVSSQGWAWGYAGGGLLLAINLVFYMFREQLGVSTELAVRLNLSSAGLWWLVFGYFAITGLRERGAQRTLPKGDSYVSIGFKQLRQTLGEIRHYPHTLRYLIAYLLYNDGVQTVIAMSSVFGTQELGMSEGDMAMLFLMVQIVAFFGAMGFGKLAQRLNAKRTIVVTLLIWCSISLWAVISLRSSGEFWLLGAVVGLVLGGSQALSRSLFSQMIPREREAEFFSFYEISERGTSWIGPILFGLVAQATGTYRLSVFSLIVLFASGLYILLRVDVPRAIREAGQIVPASLETEATPA
ncbi:MAG: MFS transporter [Anaerolineae bacterium]